MSESEQREGLLAVTIPERKGSFQRFCHVIGHRQVTEFNYRYADDDDAHVFVGLELRDGVADKDALIDTLRGEDYAVVDLGLSCSLQPGNTVVWCRWARRDAARRI